MEYKSEPDSMISYYITYKFSYQAVLIHIISNTVPFQKSPGTAAACTYRNFNTGKSKLLPDSWKSSGTLYQ